MLYGHGAGMMPTASAVVSDLVDLARNIVTGANCRVPILSYQPEQIQKIPVLEMGRPGLPLLYPVLGPGPARGAVNHQRHLGRSADQHRFGTPEGTKNRPARSPIVMLTHEAREADVKTALARIEALDIISEAPVLIRIEDENGIE